MSDENSWKRKRAGGHSRVLGCGIALLLLGVGLVMTTALMVQARNRRVQLQSDPHVATVWLLGATWGPNHSVTFGSPSQKWLNEHNITAFGSYAVLHSPYTGEPGGVEFWFDYQSYLPSQELECHRVGEMAFTDDLGQTYHGYLDFQGKTVGVYLPAYDHAAHRLFCNIHWMPRRPAAPSPVSTPMTFMVNLPPTS
ncbi:MAG TPA: hypothetical protein VKU00_29360, partial [Chthonomonadaceae bacterium]|nr:hypothetical protein [Chthonomonadaceae bacterium]